jgi:hypothetical protein
MTMGFLEALSKATAEDLAAIDKRLEELDNESAGLRAAKRILDTKLNGVPQKRGAAARANCQPASNGTPRQAPGGGAVGEEPRAYVSAPRRKLQRESDRRGHRSRIQDRLVRP